MKLAFLLHLYQPSLAEAAVLKEIAESSYLPLVRLIKKKKNVNFTLNIPLSLINLLEKNEYSTILTDLKDLHDNGRIELVGTGAYHPLLTKLPEQLVVEEIILQEYALGYYFGNHTGFEGENAVLIKDVKGFFPPELAVNSNSVKTLDSLGYSWTLVDETAFLNPQSIDNGSVWHTSEHKIKLALRNRSLSNLIAFKRDADTSTIINTLKDHITHDTIIALDGETFGHHNKEGIILLDYLLDELLELDYEVVTVSDLVEDNTSQLVPEILESTWGASTEEMLSNNCYPMWSIPNNAIHKNQWEIFNAITANYLNYPDLNTQIDGFENVPFWNNTFLESLTNEDLKEYLAFFIHTHRLLQSDQFWWASTKELPNNVRLFDPKYIRRFNKFILSYCDKLVDESLKSTITTKINEIEQTLNVAENS